MKRLFFPLCWVQIGIALFVLAIGPGAWATDGPYSGGPAELDFDTGQLFDSQHPDHPVACSAGMSCAGLTDSGTSTATGTGTGTFYVRHDVPLTMSATATGTGDVSGSGTVSYLPKWGTASTTSTATTKTLSDSVIRQHTALGATSIQIGGHLDPVTDGASEMGYDTQRWLNLHLKGAVALYGATSGKVQLAAPSVATSYTLSLPPNDGDAGQFLQTNGSGAASWAFATELGTATASHVFVLPNATKTVTSTETFTETDFAQTAAGASKIPMAGTNSKIDINWLPTGTSTATSVLVTGGDSRLVPAVMVLPNANETVTGTFTVQTTDIAMTTPTADNIPLAGTDNKIDVGWLPATATPTASKIPIADASGTLNSWVTSGRMVTYVSSEPTGGFTLATLGSGVTDLVTLTGTFSGRAIIHGQALVYRDAPSVVGCQLDITLDGTQVGVPGMVTAAAPDGSQATRSVSVFAMVTLAGAYTIKLRGNGLSGTCNINNGANQVGAYVQFFN